MSRSGEIGSARTVCHRWCAVAFYAAILGCVKLPPAPSQLIDHSLEPGITAAKEPITPIPDAAIADLAKVELGERLFDDPRLSHDNSRSCSSCHDLSTNGASPRRRDVGLDGAELPLNTLTVFNAVLSFRFGWEGRIRTADTTAASLKNTRIMAKTAEAAERLGADPEVRQKFRRRLRTWAG